MHKRLAVIARVLGDLKVSINGENVVSLNVKGIPSNALSLTLMGTYGNIVGISNHPERRSALGVLENVLSNITPILYSDDERFAPYLTGDISLWLRSHVYLKICDAFNKGNVSKVTARYNVDCEHILTVSVELLGNMYTRTLFEKMTCVEYLGEITSVAALYTGKYTVNAFRKEDGKETGILFGDRRYRDHLFDTTDIKEIKHIYKLNENEFLVTKHYYNFHPTDDALVLEI